MQTRIHPTLAGSPTISEAETILRACVHCGFCNATCPTYLEQGDERDGPRGRIYLIKQLLENGESGSATRTHLDRCLSCRNCETTCPSGVSYGRLLDIGRELIERQQRRPWHERLQRAVLRQVIPHRRRFTLLLRIGQWLRPLLPAALSRKVPAPQQAGAWPARDQPRRMLALAGCVQPGATPRTNAAAARVLHRLGIDLEEAPAAGCCGAMDYHLGAHTQGLERARRNIDAWWPQLESGAEALVMTASGCGSMIKEYGHLLRDDPVYAAKARTVSERTLDLSEVLQSENIEALPLAPSPALTAVHCPCSLQHAQRLPDSVSRLLQRMGFRTTEATDNHLCCGSAGSYSLLQPDMAEQLLRNKVRSLEQTGARRIVTANVGCQLHLASGTELPVQHWIESVDEALG